MKWEPVPAATVEPSQPLPFQPHSISKPQCSPLSLYRRAQCKALGGWAVQRTGRYLGPRAGSVLELSCFPVDYGKLRFKLVVLSLPEEDIA